MSSSFSATSRLSRAFSTSSSFSLFASSDFMPPYWLLQRWKVYSLTPRCWSTCAIERPNESMASASRSLLMTCSGVCRVRFIGSLEASLGPAGAGRDSDSAGPEIGGQVTLGSLERPRHLNIAGPLTDAPIAPRTM
jgi:hypothetical protein